MSTMRAASVLGRFNYRQKLLLGLRWYADKPSPPPLGTTVKPDPVIAQHDYIGPPDKDSNLRPIVRHIPPNETLLGQRLRERRLEIEAWNQDFWARHNKRFYEEKELFITAHKNQGIEEISADKMSVFYKDFLDKNKKLHFYYNVSWYMKNFDLLVMSGQHRIQMLWQKARRST